MGILPQNSAGNLMDNSFAQPKGSLGGHHATFYRADSIVNRMTLSQDFWLVRWENLCLVAEQSNKEPQLLVMAAVGKKKKKD